MARAVVSAPPWAPRLGGKSAGASVRFRRRQTASPVPERPPQLRGAPAPSPGLSLAHRCAVFSPQFSATTRIPARRAPTADTSARCTQSAGTSPPASAAAASPATRGTAGSAWLKVSVVLVLGGGGRFGAVLQCCLDPDLKVAGFSRGDAFRLSRCWGAGPRRPLSVLFHVSEGLPLEARAQAARTGCRVEMMQPGPGIVGASHFPPFLSTLSWHCSQT